MARPGYFPPEFIKELTGDSDITDKEVIIVDSGKPRPKGLEALDAVSQILRESPYSNMSMKDFGWGRTYRTSKFKQNPKEQGRNEKCNCHSGKKYKNCCGKVVVEE